MPASSLPYDSPAIVTFAKELKAWRSAAGLNKKELADLLGYTDSYVGQIELCKNIPSEDFAKALDTFFATNGVFHRLWERIIDSRSLVTLPPGFREYVERERAAMYAQVFSVLLVNGLFQTEEYALAVMESPERAITKEQVAKRMERQDLVLREDSPARVVFTLDEGVLRRVIGSREVQRGQLRALLEASERPNVVLNVVPLGTGYYPGLAGSFTILGFEDGSNIAYAETFGMGTLFEDQARIARYLMDYDVIRGQALHAEGTRSLIREILTEL